MATNVSITAHEAEDAYTVEATPRGFKKIDPFVVKWEYPLMVRDDCLNPKKLKTGVMRQQEYFVESLLEVAVEEAVTSTELKDRVMENTGMSKPTFDRLMRDFKKMEGVTQTEKTKWVYNNPKANPKIT